MRPWAPRIRWDSSALRGRQAGRGGRRTSRARARRACRAGPSRPPPPPPTGGAASSLRCGRCPPTSARGHGDLEHRAGLLRHAAGHAHGHLLRGHRRLGQAERVHDAEAVPGAVAPPRAAARVDARAIGVRRERVRHRDPPVAVEHDHVAVGERAQIGRVLQVRRGPGRRERAEDLRPQRELVAGHAASLAVRENPRHGRPHDRQPAGSRGRGEEVRDAARAGGAVRPLGARAREVGGHAVQGRARASRSPGATATATRRRSTSCCAGARPSSSRTSGPSSASGTRCASRPDVARSFEAGPEGAEVLAFGAGEQGDAEMIKDFW